MTKLAPRLLVSPPKQDTSALSVLNLSFLCFKVNNIVLIAVRSLL
jgi:hypothetical protein